MVPFGGWEMPLEYADRHDRRAPRLPPRRRRVRRVAPRHGAGRRCRRPGDAAGRALQRPRQDRSRPRPVHPPARRRRRLGARRHHRVVAPGRRRRGVPRLRRDAQRVEHRPRPRRRRRARDDARAGRARRAGSAGPRSPGDGVPRRRRRRALPRRAGRRGTARRARSPAPATRASPASRSPFRRRPPPTSGRRSSAPACNRPAWAHATRCAWRPGCRCTATSWARGSRRCRPGSAGSWRGRSRRSVVARALEAERDAGRRPGTSSASPPRAAGRRAPSAPCCSRATPSARSRAATSHRCSDTASPWRSSRPSVGPGTPVAIDVRGTALPGTVVETPFVAKR